jgi:hypothetical protein
MKALDAGTLVPIEEAGDETRDGKARELELRSEWERGFAGYDPGAARDARVAGVMRAAGVSEGRARVLIGKGEPALGLVSYEARVRELVKRAVAKDKAGETLESVERRGVEGLVRERGRALAEAVRVERDVLGDAVKQHRAEVETVRKVRLTANVLLNAEGHLLKGVVALAKSLEDDINAKDFRMKPRDKVGLIRDVAQIVKTTAETARLAVVTERVILGKPLDTLGGKRENDGMGPLTPEEAGRYVALAMRAATRARKRAEPAVIDVRDVAASPAGGTPDDEIGELERLLEEGDADADEDGEG